MSQKIDVPPTWSDILPLMLEVVQHGGFESRKKIMEQFERMAITADWWNAEAKAENENGGK